MALGDYAPFGTKHFTATAYHPERNGRAELFNKTIFSRVLHYVAEPLRHFDIYVQPLTYTNHAQGNHSTTWHPLRDSIATSPSVGHI